MRALSLQQPWAWLIVHGFKDIENRKWPTKFRGEFLVHASKKFDKLGYLYVRDEIWSGLVHVPVLPSVDEFLRGGIVGKATIIDCVEQSDSVWFFGPYGFVVRDALPLNFVELNGMLGFFTVPNAVLDELGLAA